MPKALVILLVDLKSILDTKTLKSEPSHIPEPIKPSYGDYRAYQDIVWGPNRLSSQHTELIEVLGSLLIRTSYAHTWDTRIIQVCWFTKLFPLSRTLYLCSPFALCIYIYIAYPPPLPCTFHFIVEELFWLTCLSNGKYITFTLYISSINERW